MEYSNKVILITGASSGIGRAVARALSHHDNRIVVTARRAERLRSLQHEIEANGSRCLVLPGDATAPEHAESVVREIVQTFDRIDLAILNVGAGPPSNTLTASVETILGAMTLTYTTNYSSAVDDGWIDMHSWIVFWK